MDAARCEAAQQRVTAMGLNARGAAAAAVFSAESGFESIFEVAARDSRTAGACWHPFGDRDWPVGRVV